MSISAEVKGLKEVQAKMEQIVRDLSGKPMVNAMRDATLVVERSAKQNSPVDTGRLRASIVPEVIGRDKEVQGIVGSNVKYAPFMELGTRPHWPPLESIIAWVHRKQMTGTYSIKTHRRMGSKTTQEGQDRATAFLIARAISRRGTKALRYLGRAIDDNREKIHDILSRAVETIVRKR